MSDFFGNEKAIRKLAAQVRDKMTELESNIHHSNLFDANAVSNFTEEVRAWVNKAPIGSHEHKKALNYALEACAVLDSLFKQQPTQMELKKIQAQLNSLTKESTSTITARICLGIAQALLTPVTVCLDILIYSILAWGGPSGLPERSLTGRLWGLQDDFFQDLGHPGVTIIESFCNAAQEVIQQDKTQQQQADHRAMLV